VNRIAVLGAGQIGGAVVEMLGSTGDYELRLADQDAARLDRAAHTGVARERLDLSDPAALVRFLDGADAVVSALPFHLNTAVIDAARAAGVHYFDLTEDVATARRAREAAAGARTAFVPQCGLAPGFVSIAAMDLVRRFERLDAVRLRVGALPRCPTNALKYNLTWSTDGLINEYCNPCEAIHEGRRVEVLPLEGLESLALDGVEYEAFNTSGGLGTLADTLDGQVAHLDYKTIRYPGHCVQMRLLAFELGLAHRRAIFRDILEAAIPATDDDVVIVFVSVTGRRGGRLDQATVARRVYAQSIGGRHWTAIQVTTAAGVCAVVDLMRDGRLPSTGVVRPQDVPLEVFLANRFGRYYA
jgi:saccharopine dehydrogenase-like NADP-dependent oxidoreductase